MAYPLAVVESDTARVSVLPMVESDTARVSVLPLAGGELPAIFWGEGRLGCGWSGCWPAMSPTFRPFFGGKVALDVVGLGVGPPCLRLDSEETLPALLDERGEMSCTVPGVAPDGGPVEGAPVLEPLEHSVLAITPLNGEVTGYVAL